MVWISGLSNWDGLMDFHDSKLFLKRKDAKDDGIGWKKIIWFGDFLKFILLGWIISHGI